MDDWIFELTEFEAYLYCNDIREILEHHLFFHHCEKIKNILKPMKKTILLLEFKSSTLVDCFIQLI